MNGKGFLGMLLLVVLLVWPVIPGVPYDTLNTAVLAGEYLVVVLSLVLLIGMVGQISLAQASFVGMGAFVAALTANRLGFRFPATLFVGLGAGAALATFIGVVALRVRGLYLAVATLIFAYVCDQYLFSQPWLVQSQSGTSIPADVIGRPGTFPFLDMTDAHIFYYVSLSAAAASLYAVANVRDSKVGRAFAAIRGSEIAAASLGINVMRYKLVGFALAGALAGLGGALELVGQQTVAPQQFNFSNSLYFLSIAVVGGLRSLGGAVAACVLFAVLVGEVFFRFPKVANYLDLVSATLLLVVLLFFRGGLGAIPARLAPAGRRTGLIVSRGTRPVERSTAPLVVRASAGRVAIAKSLSEVTSQISTHLAKLPGIGGRRGRAATSVSLDPLDVTGLLSTVSREAEVIRLRMNPTAGRTDLRERLASTVSGQTMAGEPTSDGRRSPLLVSADNITVQFGGLVAVNNATLRVGAGEIVGLIGPNGAGKTTLFNSILGLNQPTSGEVSLFGRVTTEWPVHRRASLGVGRTFQIIQLFGDLTVFDNLLVATHLQNRAGFWGSLMVSSKSRRAEHSARERVRSVLRLMDLEQYADRKVAGLPFGVLRLVEVARTLVTGARLVCFDEPASGLDSNETEQLIEWFRLLRDLGITLLVIEHDVDMVVRLCDYIYVLDQGHVIAEGLPAEIRRDPKVISSYLGTMEEAS